MEVEDTGPAAEAAHESSVKFAVAIATVVAILCGVAGERSGSARGGGGSTVSDDRWNGGGKKKRVGPHHETSVFFAKNGRGRKGTRVAYHSATRAYARARRAAIPMSAKFCALVALFAAGYRVLSVSFGRD